MVSRKRNIGIIAGIFWGVFLVSLAVAAQERPIVVSCQGTDRVLKYDETTGAYLGELIGPAEGLRSPRGLTFGPDGNLYICSAGNDKIFKYDWTSGELAEFEGAESSELEKPETLLFDQDNSLYVSNGDNSVKWYDADGAYQGDFVTSDLEENGDLTRPRGMAFDKSWNLYVTSNDDNTVKKYDADGEYVDDFVKSGTSGEEDELSGPRGILFGADGNLYVVSRKTDNVLRYDGSDGDFFDVFASGDPLDAPAGLLFASDGHLLVCSSSSNQVLQFDGASGNYLGVFAEGLAAEDGLSYLAQVPADEDPPVKVNNTGIENVQEGGTKDITQNELQYEDAQGPSNVTYTVKNGPTSGQLELDTTPGGAITSFTQAQIDEGLLNYVNFGTDNEASDSFGFEVDDGLGNVEEDQSFSITVTLVDNDPPVLVFNTGTKVTDGNTVRITKNQLQYEDEQPTSSITYFLTSPPSEGRLQFKTDPDTEITTFTQADIDDDLLDYVNDGDKNGSSDSFDFKVDDGQGNTLDGQSFSIEVTEADDPGDEEEADSNNKDNDDQYCWVSVCAAGFPVEKALSLLRTLRDRLLLHGPFGRFFVKLYYKTSPPIAKYLAGHEALRTTVQCGLVPVVYGVKYPKTTGLALLWLVVSVVAVINGKRK